MSAVFASGWSPSLQLPFRKTNKHPVLTPWYKERTYHCIPKVCRGLHSPFPSTYMRSFDQQNVSKGVANGAPRHCFWLMFHRTFCGDCHHREDLGPYIENGPVSHASSTLFCFYSIHCTSTSTLVEPLSLSFCNIGYHGCGKSSFPGDMDVEEV
jgi:hypothetical protein